MTTKEKKEKADKALEPAKVFDKKVVMAKWD